MIKFIKFLLLVTLGVMMAWSAPLTFSQDANASERKAWINGTLSNIAST